MSEKTEALKQRIMDVQGLIPQPRNAPAMFSYWLDEFEKAVYEEGVENGARKEREFHDWMD